MRTSSISYFSRGAFCALATFATLATSGALVAQTPSRDDARSSGSTLRVDDDTGELRSPFARELDLTRFGVEPQDDTYSVTGLFSQYHGKYMVDRKRFEPNLEVWGGYQAEGGLSDETGEFSFYEVGVRLDAELPVDPDTFLIYGGLFTMREYDMDMSTGIADERLYQTFVTLGIGRFFSEELLMEARFQPGLATDFDGTLKGDDWKYFGEILATYRANEQLYWKIGVRADETWDDTPVYPLLGASFLINENWRIDVLAPSYAEIAFLPDPSIVAKVGISLQGQDYHYRVDLPGNVEQELDWRTQEFRAYGDLTWRLTDNLSFRGRAGATLAGKYDIERVGAPDYDGQIDPVFFGEVGLGFTF